MATILIVEDNPKNLKLVAFLLRQAGHDVLEAADAQCGIELARIHHPPLILMDIQLPGMDGLTAARTLKMDDSLSNSKIYALTALAMKGDEERIRAAGCDGYISKPIRYQEFLQAVASALSQAGGAPMAHQPE